jgi:hypothetical protein
MNTSYSRSIVAVAVAAALAVGCASVPKRPAGSEAVRAKLVALQNDAALASQAPIATKDAEAAVELTARSILPRLRPRPSWPRRSARRSTSRAKRHASMRVRVKSTRPVPMR